MSLKQLPRMVTMRDERMPNDVQRQPYVKIHRTSNTILPGSWWFSPSQYQHRNCILPLLVHRCEIMSKLGRNLSQRCCDWIGIHKLLRQCERQETSDWVCHACIHATSCRPGYGFKILPQTTVDGSKLDSLTVYNSILKHYLTVYNSI